MVAGYPVAPRRGSDQGVDARPSGIGSTGVPTDASTIPPGTDAATARNGPRRSCGYGGGTKAIGRG